MLSRRWFLKAAAAATTSAVVLDPERLLWVPGKKLISIPKPESFPMVGVDFSVAVDRSALAMYHITREGVMVSWNAGPWQHLVLKSRSLGFTQLIKEHRDRLKSEFALRQEFIVGFGKVEKYNG